MTQQQHDSDDGTDAEPLLSARVPTHPLAHWIRAIDAVVDECRIHVDSDDGLWVSAVDRTTAFAVEATLSPAAFEAFEVADGCPDAIAVDVERLGRLPSLLAERNRGSQTTLEIRDGDGEQHPYCLHASSDQHTHEFDTVDPASVRRDYELTPSKAPDAASVRVMSWWLAEAVEAVAGLSEAVAVEYHPDEEDGCLRLTGADRDDDGRVRERARATRPRNGTARLAGVARDGRAFSVFSGVFLEDIAGALPDDRAVTLRLDVDWPMEAEFGVGAPAGDGRPGTVRFAVAPRIDPGPFERPEVSD